MLLHLHTNKALSFYTANIPYVYAFAPAYWINPSSLHKGAPYWEHHAGEGISYNYNTIINNSNTDFHLMVTWNDFGENSYWYANTTVPSNFYLSDVPIYTHRGFGRLAKYYNEWYKTEVMPPVSDEFMVMSYRPHSYTATAPTSSDRAELWSVDWGGGKLSLNPSGEVEDSIYITTVLTSPATVEVEFRSTITTIAVDNGVKHSRVEYTASTSAYPTMRLYRDDTLLSTFDGLVAISEVATSTRNFNIYSDYKEI